MQRFTDLTFPRNRRAHAARSVLFTVGLFAVVLHFFLSPNVFDAMGLDFSTPGGNPLTKIHPANQILIIASLFVLFRSKYEFARLCHDWPGLMLFVIAIPLLGLYSIVWTGYSGSAVFIESFWAAGLLALVLEGGSDTHKRRLAVVLVALCVFNALVAIGENLTYTHLFPLAVSADHPLVEEEFRSHAFFSHPLTGSMVSVMVIYLVYAMRPRLWIAAPVYGLLLVGMLAYGGRTALAVLALVIVAATFINLIRGILVRHLEMDFILALVCGAILLPVAFAVLIDTTTIGDRIVNSFYFDDSARARTTQWTVLAHLTISNWLFGIPLADLQQLKYQIGLGAQDTDLENFWLLLFLNLGAIGFTAFLAVFATFLVHLARYSGRILGWVLVVSTIVIASGSNSLGVKTSDLLILTAFVVAMSGYPPKVPLPLVQPKRETTPLRQRAGALSSLVPARNSGFAAGMGGPRGLRRS
ncbi:MAG: VpsF family polysaccharide biosynthesis protein [Acetobacteraceae bacterium]